MTSLRLDRRRLLQAGVAGAAGLVLGRVAVLDAPAYAAALPTAWRRSAWRAAVGGPIALRDGGGTLRLAAVADLSIAERIPELRGHDAAFALRFDGPAGLPQGVQGLRHATLGDIDLFLVPMGGGRYEAVVDRTVRIAGFGVEEELPIAAPEPARVAAPSVAATAPVIDAAGRRVARPRRRAAVARPRLRRAALARGGAARAARAELALAHAAGLVEVRALLLRDGRVVARGGLRLDRAGAERRARLRLAGRRALPRGRVVLALTLIERDGRVTRVRRPVRLR